MSLSVVMCRRIGKDKVCCHVFLLCSEHFILSLDYKKIINIFTVNQNKDAVHLNG